MKRRLRRIGMFSMLCIGLFVGWVVAILGAVMAGKKIDRDILKSQFRATVD